MAQPSGTGKPLVPALSLSGVLLHMDKAWMHLCLHITRTLYMHLNMSYMYIYMYALFST